MGTENKKPAVGTLPWRLLLGAGEFCGPENRSFSPNVQLDHRLGHKRFCFFCEKGARPMSPFENTTPPTGRVRFRTIAETMRPRPRFLKEMRYSRPCVAGQSKDHGGDEIYLSDRVVRERPIGRWMGAYPQRGTRQNLSRYWYVIF